MNQILLAMSTLPPKIRKSNFIYSNDDIYYEVKDCLSQLEPVVRLMMQQEPEEKLEVIMLCTSASMTDAREQAIEDEVLQQKYTKEYTSVEFFMKRICEAECADGDYDEIPQPEGGFYKKYYSKSGTLSFVQIPINEMALQEGMYKTVEYMRRHKKKGQFWIDTHGGFRDISLISNAIVSLLRVDGIVPQKIYGVKYGQGVSEIVEQNQAFRTFDFVSGMTEFINYGRADVLQEYYKDSKDPQVLHMLQAMNTIAEGTQECDPQKYIDGLDDLSACLKEVTEPTSMLSIFIDYIRDDYGPLLDEDRRTIDIIARCVDKKLYQQALTFMEAKMPLEFFDKGIVYYPNATDDSVKMLIAARKQSAKQLWKDDINFVFDNLIHLQYYYNNHRKQQILQEKINEQVISADYTKEEENKVLFYEYLKDMASGNMNRPLSGFVQYPQSFSNICVDVHVETALTEASDKTKAGHLLRMHKALKECRNQLNHGNGDRPDMDVIIKTMRRYIKLVREIM